MKHIQSTKIILSIMLAGILITGLISCNKDIVTGKPSPLISLEDVRGLYQGSPVTLTSSNMQGAGYITGVVISDPSAGNAPEGLVVLQSFRRKKMRGIALNLGTKATQYAAGDSLTIHVENTTLNRVNGILQISGIADDGVVKAASGCAQVINLYTTTFTQLTNSMNDYECTLVQLNAAVAAESDLGKTFSGDRNISDWANNIIFHTEPTASFASMVIPDLADYTGIPFGDGEQISFRLRSSSDIVAQTLEPHKPGELYANFPEGWEKPIKTKTSNTDGTAVLPTGEWQMNGMYIISSANIKSKKGTWTVMMQKGKDVVLEMNFNLPYGASKFSFYCGAAVPTSDGASTVRAEYSQDSGNTWTQIGEDLQVSDINKFYYQEYALNIKGPVRFRIHKPITGTGVVDQGRLSVDDVAIYQN